MWWETQIDYITRTPINSHFDEVVLYLAADSASLVLKPSKDSDSILPKTYFFYPEVAHFFPRIFKNSNSKIKELKIDCSKDKTALEKLHTLISESQTHKNQIEVEKISWKNDNFSKELCQLLLSLVKINNLKSVDFYLKTNDNVSWLIDLEEFEGKKGDRFLFSTNYLNGRVADSEWYQLNFEELIVDYVKELIENLNKWPDDLILKQRIPGNARFQVYGNIENSIMMELSSEYFDPASEENGTVLWFNTCDKSKRLRLSLSAGEPYRMLQGMLVSTTN